MLMWPLIVGTRETLRGLGLFTYQDSEAQEEYEKWVKVHGTSRVILGCLTLPLLIYIIIKVIIDLF